MIETLTSEFTPDFILRRNPSGRLQFTACNNTIYDGVYPVRAFPVSAPEEGLSLVNQEGHELAWINRLSDLPVEVRTLIEEELVQREFMPEILRINHVSSFATPSAWEVETDRGEALLILKTEDHIRRLAHSCLLISDNHGVNFLIREIDQMDNHSRKLLDRFL